MLEELLEEIQKNAKYPEGKKDNMFSKTGPGDYAQGHIFLGVDTRTRRELAKKYSNLSLSEVSRLMDKNINDYKSIGLLILHRKYKKSGNKDEIANFYLKIARKVNNWSLVDISAYNLLGDFLLDKDRKVLYRFAKSRNMWERRIAIVSTYAFIKNGEFADTLRISEVLFDDKEDLIHKAMGWMLREVGKKDVEILKDFIRINYRKIPRTTLRYAIERFPEKERKKFLKGEFK
jgi:3-methyladenine DNA glycosylase AlkD